MLPLSINSIFTSFSRCFTRWLQRGWMPAIFPFRCVRFRMAEVQQIIGDKNKVVTSIGEFEYDGLVIATGADTNFFGNQNLMNHAMPMKTTLEALQLRYKLLQNF